MKRHRFTLLELLVATMASAVIMAALVVVLAVAWRLQRGSQERLIEEAPREAVLQHVRRELSAAVPPVGILAGPFIVESSASGDLRMDTLEFVSAIGTVTADAVGGELVRLHYYLTENGATGEFALVRTARRHLLAVEEESPDEVVLLRGVTSFEISCFDGSDWVDGWDSTVNENQLPVAAMLSLRFAERADGQTPRPLDMVVPFAMQSLMAADTGGGQP